jgi:hypothetical protein
MRVSPHGAPDLRVHLIAVEGNLGHIGFASDERSLHHAGMVWGL